MWDYGLLVVDYGWLWAMGDYRLWKDDRLWRATGYVLVYVKHRGEGR